MNAIPPLSETKEMILGLGQEHRQRRVENAMAELGLAVNDAQANGLTGFLSALEAPSPAVQWLMRAGPVARQLMGDSDNG